MKNLYYYSVHFLFRFVWKVINKAEKEILLRRFRHVGKNPIFFPLTSSFAAENISIGDDVFIGQHANFGGDVTIGNRVMFGPRVSILAANHQYALAGKSPRFIVPSSEKMNIAPVIIEDEVWCGANVTILGNVRVGIGAVIGAASVVVQDICPFTVSVGSPCRPVRNIFDDEKLLYHLTSLSFSENSAVGIIDRRKAMLSGQELPVIDKTEQYLN